MTLKEIQAMFEVGQQWEAVNTYVAKASGTRTVVQKLSTQMVWKTPIADRSWMQFPKASQVIEARDGFLSFNLFTPQEQKDYTEKYHVTAPSGTVTLTRVSA